MCSFTEHLNHYLTNNVLPTLLKASLLKRLIVQVSALNKVTSFQQQHKLKPGAEMYLVKSSPDQFPSEQAKKSPCQILLRNTHFEATASNLGHFAFFLGSSALWAASTKMEKAINLFCIFKGNYQQIWWGIWCQHIIFKIPPCSVQTQLPEHPILFSPLFTAKILFQSISTYYSFHIAREKSFTWRHRKKRLSKHAQRNCGKWSKVDS